MEQDFDSSSLGMGQFIVRPPYFNGETYSYWKTRMNLFIQANDYHEWRIISNNDLKVPNDEDGWEEGYKKKT
ncbi:hypothetical protein PVK06_019613 [Gossypium arboreum]|uniref:DUF4219 domain-containing protein n=1 Tax=Gossypium arboreum TaxID=29729 RepID=A0ABR0PKP7_GOSAR|nr:hypothetical protein PVK06_019613 [Gossypium arboreum]